MTRPSSDVNIVRVRNGQRTCEADRVASEEPLEVRLHDRTFAVIMRTPGADCELAAGFLFAERVFTSPDDLGTIELCRDVENVVKETLADVSPEALERVLAERRQVVGNSSCGVCGRLSVESLKADVPPLSDGGTISASVVCTLPELLRAAQPLFDATGGIHAAGLFESDGSLTTSAEDVGRHNAVDKVIGRMLMRDALPLQAHTLFVSGRTSFEIVQKAWCAGIPIVASVSAPSSFAIALAQEAGLTLIGFVRDGHFNIYTHEERVTP